jgi:hypothetical protein
MAEITGPFIRFIPSTALIVLANASSKLAISPTDNINNSPEGAQPRNATENESPLRMERIQLASAIAIGSSKDFPSFVAI